jgi:hypothetical protein
VGKPCAPPARPVSGEPHGEHPAPAPPYTAPRLRWSAPEYDRVNGELIRTTVYRLGKGCEHAADALEAAGGELDLSELADALDVARTRDVRRRYVSRLEAAGVVECGEAGDVVRLTADWLGALNRDRERAGEIAAHHRDSARYDREREAYRRRGERPVQPAPAPGETKARRESAPHRRREAVEDAITALFRERPEYRGRRPGQIACALAMRSGDEFPRGISPGGPPRDSEVLEVLEANGAVA